jgi:hypothetical protein
VGFVDQQDRGAALLLRLEENLVKRREPPWLAGGGAGDFVFVARLPATQRAPKSD